MTSPTRVESIGADLQRLDGLPKVLGSAPYAYEQPVARPVYLHAVQAAIAKGTVTAINTEATAALPGVLAVLTPWNAPRLVDTGDHEVMVLQSAEVAFRGQVIAAVVAESPEVARHGAEILDVEYAVAPHHTTLSTAVEGDEQAALELPRQVSEAEISAAVAVAPIVVDETYSTPPEYNAPIEPHTTVAIWDGERLTVYESTQGVHYFRDALAPLFGLQLAQVHVVSPYVGGGFGSKIEVHAPAVLAVMAARLLPGLAVKVALTRQQMFGLSGYRPATVQRVRLAAGPDGALAALAVDVVEQTSRLKLFEEGSDGPARMMYAAPKRRTTRRPAVLDVPVPSWMRGPGRCPGMFGLEVAMDELAARSGVDPIVLRVRNEPATDPETGEPHAFRHLVDCLQQGAEQFEWWRRESSPRQRRRDGWWVGTGVASVTFPHWRDPDNEARIEFLSDGSYRVQVAAADIGTGSRTALTQIAADALNCPPQRVRMEIGDSALPLATVAGGSTGTASWAGAVFAAAEAFRRQYGREPKPGAAVQARAQDTEEEHRSEHSYGAQFAEVRVSADTGEIRVSRMLGVFSVGRVINTRMARSQLIGGMTMGIGMALHEQGVMDGNLGTVVNRDLAEYHIPTCADIEDIDATWLDERDAEPGRLGARGVGEIGIVGVAAAIANAAFHATGVRVRDLPLTADAFLTQ